MLSSESPAVLAVLMQTPSLAAARAASPIRAQ